MNDFDPVSALLGGALIGLAASVFLLTHGKVAGISGATDLGDGRVVLILDLPSLLAVGRRGDPQAHVAAMRNGSPRAGSAA